MPLINTGSTAPNYLLSELESGTLYTTKVRAVASYGLVGEWSTYSSFTTGKLLLCHLLK